MEVWLLVAWIKGQPVDLGFYVTEERCRAAAVHQMPHWRKEDPLLTWQCRMIVQ